MVDNLHHLQINLTITGMSQNHPLVIIYLAFEVFGSRTSLKYNLCMSVKSRILFQAKISMYMYFTPTLVINLKIYPFNFNYHFAKYLFENRLDLFIEVSINNMIFSMKKLATPANFILNTLKSK